MKRGVLLMLAGLVFLGGCGMKDPATRKREEEERKRKEALAAAAAAGPRVMPTVEADHVLVKADPSQIYQVKRPSVIVVKVARNGTIDTERRNFKGDALASTERGGAQNSTGCCTESDPPEMRAMAGQMHVLAQEQGAKEGAWCDEPILVSGDYKAPWSRSKMVLEAMVKAKCARLVFATNVENGSLAGVLAKLPSGWDPAAKLPAGVKRVDVGAKGQDLEITVDGAKYGDVASAVKALQGTKEIAIHPVDARTPLWAVVKGVELSNALAPAGPVQFMMADE